MACQNITAAKARQKWHKQSSKIGCSGGVSRFSVCTLSMLMSAILFINESNLKLGPKLRIRGVVPFVPLNNSLAIIEAKNRIMWPTFLNRHKHVL